MAPWTGVVLALGEAGSDRMDSRLSTYLHPLAGRPLAWHAVHAVASLRTPPARVWVAGAPEVSGDSLADVPGEVRVADRSPSALSPLLHAATDEGRVLVLDGAACVDAGALEALAAEEGDALLEGRDGDVLAAWLGAESAATLAEHAGDLLALRHALRGAREVRGHGGMLVRDRAGLAAAAEAVRDRVVRRLMDGGVTFLLPHTTLVDVDVRVGRDTVIYPGVVLEGETTVGEETVIGPGCRIISSWVGSGVELKGYNYISHTSIRNRAILEAHVRRGFD